MSSEGTTQGHTGLHSLVALWGRRGGAFLYTTRETRTPIRWAHQILGVPLIEIAIMCLLRSPQIVAMTALL